MKNKETLEEAAANLADPSLCKTDNWIAGAKYVQEKMYSEEDSHKAYCAGSGYNIDCLELEWFENFIK